MPSMEAIPPSPATAGASDDASRRWYPVGTHITVRGLTKRFDGVTVYDNFDLNIPKGRITSVFGPNGCGKSTLINMISGILPYDAGQILFEGKVARETRIGYVFQNYREAVFPWMRAIDNIRYPLQFLDISKGERQTLLDQVVDSFGVSFDLNRYPYEMSGGQQQLVSIMRALVVEPEVLFLDEPFSALDYEMVMFLRGILQKVLKEREVTTLLVSHDLDEAVLLADEVLLLTKRPTRVAERLEFNAPRPRGADTSVTPEFVATKTRALEVFQREVRA
ncbi:MAG: ATP-binding cassette domain-containing protein [Hydrogenophaga sp.]|nr:ATP-binding cassette domain-containing protein [Hydrogenophaga sp.]MDP2073359.1 ATP-binding cassette domain-containing protein [Hydrogenophaga sp.]MDP3106747.1 ATP-binding cassette domain-containing protein [Hydrogenophaga sp.]MDP3203155.1 ATP-binding cassette domain-containing protein [Hydrogenophaga sp.]MDP3348887.1 ATP-binding cassette domain-containing protein [Hydrogenophaga sp.]MDZ4283808.1 ATP-binding cassette domain-containing protein [Hydrogenophaga sp.]